LTNDINSNSRSGYRSKRKKTNIVLNSLIVVVLLLIIFVAYNIFATGNDNASPKKETTKTEQKETVQKDTEKTKAEDVTSNEDDNVTDTATEEDKLSEETSTTEEAATTEDTSATEEADESQEVVAEGDGVKETENSSWQPVGTTQTGEHTANYDSSSADWQEMLNAISYATGLDKANMTVYWLGRDKSTTNGSFSTVASKDNKQKYNVYLQWVDGQGWKPTKVEDLSGTGQ